MEGLKGGGWRGFFDLTQGGESGGLKKGTLDENLYLKDLRYRLELLLYGCFTVMSVN